MLLNVKVRELELPINVGAGTQTFKWLAMITTSQYARKHPQFREEQYIAIHVTDKGGSPLFPNDQIANRLVDGDDVIVELLGPKLGPSDPSYSRDKTLWELYAYATPQDFVNVTLLFDASEYGELAHGPGIYGNFNAWGEPLAMKLWKDNIWRCNLSFPAHSEIVFKFIIDDETVTSGAYRVVTDEQHNTMNYFKVIKPPTKYEELRIKVTEPQIYIIEKPVPVKVISKRIIGNFEEVKRLTQTQINRMFENDWKKIMLHDVARNKEKREKVKEILWRYNEELRLIFRFYSSQSGRDIAYMNLIGWLGFCKICFINDDFFTISQLDEIFRRVNIEEEYDDEKLDSDPYNYRNAMMLKADPFNPDNQFTRSEFFEAIARAAIRKYTNLRLSPEEAVEKLMQQHVLRYALKPSHSDLRQKLLDNTVQRVYALYSSRLFYLFNRYTNLDRSDMKRTAKQTMNITEYRQFLRDYSLLDSDTSHRQAMSAFAMSQVEELDQADQSGLYEMVYAEFLEVIGRLANYRYAGVKSGYGDEEMDLAEKVQTILMRVFPSNRKKGKR